MTDYAIDIQRARKAVEYACIMPDGGGVVGRDAALDRYGALMRAVGAAEVTGRLRQESAHQHHPQACGCLVHTALQIEDIDAAKTLATLIAEMEE